MYLKKILKLISIQNKVPQLDTIYAWTKCFDWVLNNIHKYFWNEIEQGFTNPAHNELLPHNIAKLDTND